MVSQRMWRVVRAASFEDIADCMRVRLWVFVGEQEVPLEDEVDDDDAIAIHYLVRDRNIPVGTARLVPKGSFAKIGRLAVLRPHRCCGVGSAIMAYILATDGRAYERLILDAQLHAIPFYERWGFRAEGETFMDAGIPHRRMHLLNSDVQGGTLR